MSVIGYHSSTDLHHSCLRRLLVPCKCRNSHHGRNVSLAICCNSSHLHSPLSNGTGTVGFLFAACYATAQLTRPSFYTPTVQSLLSPSCAVVFSPPWNPSPLSASPPPKSFLFVYIQTTSDSRKRPLSNHPNTLKILRYMYLYEKACFAGYLISSVLYGEPEAPPPTRLPIHVHSVRSVFSRACHRAVLQIYGSAI